MWQLLECVDGAAPPSLIQEWVLAGEPTRRLPRAVPRSALPGPLALAPHCGVPTSPSFLAGVEPVAWLGQAVWEKLASFPEDCVRFLVLRVCLRPSVTHKLGKNLWGFPGPVDVVWGPDVFLGWGPRASAHSGNSGHTLSASAEHYVLSCSAHQVRAPCGLEEKGHTPPHGTQGLPHMGPCQPLQAQPPPPPAAVSLADSPCPGCLTFSQWCQAPVWEASVYL